MRGSTSPIILIWAQFNLGAQKYKYELGCYLSMANIVKRAPGMPEYMKHVDERYNSLRNMQIETPKWNPEEGPYWASKEFNARVKLHARDRYSKHPEELRGLAERLVEMFRKEAGCGSSYEKARDFILSDQSVMLPGKPNSEGIEELLKHTSEKYALRWLLKNPQFEQGIKSHYTGWLQREKKLPNR